VCTVVIAPAVVLAICDTRFISNALNVVQPNLSATGTETVNSQPFSVSVHDVINQHSKQDISENFSKFCTCFITICPIAIACSMGQVINPVYVCRCAYPSVGTLTIGCASASSFSTLSRRSDPASRRTVPAFVFPAKSYSASRHFTHWQLNMMTLFNCRLVTTPPPSNVDCRVFF